MLVAGSFRPAVQVAAAAWAVAAAALAGGDAECPAAAEYPGPLEAAAGLAVGSVLDEAAVECPAVALDSEAGRDVGLGEAAAGGVADAVAVLVSLRWDRVARARQGSRKGVASAFVRQIGSWQAPFDFAVAAADAAEKRVVAGGSRDSVEYAPGAARCLPAYPEPSLACRSAPS